MSRKISIFEIILFTSFIFTQSCNSNYQENKIDTSVSALVNRSYLHLTNCNYDSSKLTLQIAKEISDSINNIFNQSYIALGKARYYQSHIRTHSKAIASLEKVCNLLGKKKHPDSILIKAYLQLSYLYSHQLDIQRSKTCALLAYKYAIKKSCGSCPTIADALLAIANSYYHATDYSFAETFYRRAMEEYQKLNLQSGYHKAVIGLVSVFNNTNDSLQSIKWLDTLYFHSNLNKILLPEFYRLDGINKYLFGKYEDSQKSLKQALTEYSKLYCDLTVNEVNTFEALTAAYFQAGDYDKSIDIIEIVLNEIFGSYEDLNLLSSHISSISLLTWKAESLVSWGISDADTSKIQDGLTVYSMVDRLIEKFTKHETDGYLHQRFYNNYYYSKLIEVYDFMYEFTGDEDYLESIHVLLTKYKSQALYRNLTIDSIYYDLWNDPPLLHKYIDNELLLEKLIFNSNKQNLFSSIELLEDILNNYVERDKIITKISKTNPEIVNAINRSKVIDANRLLKYTTSQNTTIINYYIGNTFYNPNKIYILVAKEGQFKLTVLVNQEKVLSIIDSLNILIDSYSRNGWSEQSMDYSFNLLSNTLFEELFNKEMLGTEKIIIIPDNKLHKVPFDCLVTKLDTTLNTKQYFIETYILSQALSPNELFRDTRYSKSSTNTSYSNEILGMGFSSKETFIKRNIPIFGELKSTILELQAIGKNYGEDEKTLYSGYDCTKANFISFSTRSRVIHLSTHGDVIGKHRNDAYLCFSKKDTIEYLFPYEIKFKGIHPELLVLSACHSGNGKLSSEEGPLSIARSFQANGSDKVISTLWALNDAASGKLFDVFYNEYRKSNNAKEALRTAKLRFIKNPNPYSSPLHWGGVILHE